MGSPAAYYAGERKVALIKIISIKSSSIAASCIEDYSMLSC